MIGWPGFRAGALGRVLAAVLAGLLFAAPATAEDGDSLPPPQGEILLRISGDIARPNVGDEAHFDQAMIEGLPARTLATTTAVTDGVNVFEGVLIRDLLDAAGARGDTVTATALNDYIIDIPMSDFTAFDVLAALSMDGELLLPRDKGPIWIVYPRDDFRELQDIRYDYRWVWQLTHLEVR